LLDIVLVAQSINEGTLVQVSYHLRDYRSGAELKLKRDEG
jgi:hypothetical protein